MADLRIAQIAAQTGFSKRYWQRRVSAGEVPGARSIALGKRVGYLVDETRFSEWWPTQLKEITPCQKILEKGVKPGGTASATKAKITKARSEQATLDRLRAALLASGKN